MKKVSIILPSYNHVFFLKDRLDSIINQTFNDWELIIIDDKSTDGSSEVLKEFVNKYSSKIAHFIINIKNSGSGYKSWKKGIELAQSKYIWIAETDDYSGLTFLEEQIKILDQNNSIALTFCGSNYVDSKNNFLYNTDKRVLELEVTENKSKIFNEDVFLEKMPFSTYITNGSSVVFRKPKIEIPNIIFENKQSSDIFLWTFLVKGNSFAFLNKKLNFFRRHNDSTTTKMSILSQRAIYKEKIKYLNYFNLTHKFKEFTRHYIKFYVNKNKNEMFNFSLISKVESVNFIRINYFFLLVQFYAKKLINKVWKV